MCQNLAFSLSLYTGQMCTTPQNLYLPAGGIETDDGHKTVGRGRRPGSAPRSASCSATTPGRSSCSAASSTPACSSGSRPPARRRARCWCRAATVAHPAYADAIVRTPTIDRADRGRRRRLRAGVLRPGRLPDRHRRHATSRSTCSATRCKRHGAMTAAVYSTVRRRSLDDMREAALDAGVALSREPHRRRCSSTSPRRSPTSTAPAPTRPPTRRTPTARTSPPGSASIQSRRHV